ncbi:MAG TPA: hydroxysqualene dehydroxylase HpnE [Blastocatellia bacterium]
MAKRIVIIGGGFSGLAAGVSLAKSGAQVTLLERRGFLGGRAYSFTDAKTGDVVDNGQHLFMACYRHTREFLDDIGCSEFLRFQSSPRVDFLDRENGFTPFDCPPLPAPLHALFGLLKMKGLTVGDKIRTLKIAKALRPGTNGHAGTTVAKWLEALGQSERIRQRFWYPMTIATLNEDPNIASARMLKRVLELAFGGTRADSAIGMSTVGLSDLYVHGATRFIESHGGRVELNTDVRRLVIDGRRISRCELKNGSYLEGECFISAVPHEPFLRLLPEQFRTGEFEAVGRLASSPIISINLWFDRPVIDRDFVGLIGTDVQWLFNKDVICSASQQSNHIALVISAARGFTGFKPDQLVKMALKDLHNVLPESKEAKIVHSRTIKERAATLSHTIDSDHLRPPTRCSIQNLFLAGDWTATGLPATIEGAVLSGNVAAEFARQL